MKNILYMVIPCYNEEEVLHETAKRLQEKLSALIESKKISEDSRIVFVNDGSSDSTWKIICDLHAQDKIFSGINLSKNRGHQNALLAGLMTAKNFADIVISMDADLQDDINAVDEMIEKYFGGADIVYGVRNKRKTDIIFNHADYRLMSKRALEGMAQFSEVNLFLRGLVPMIGYKSDIVYYERAERFAGESKYPLKKMLFFAFQGITSLTIEPIRMITTLGFVIFMISLLMIFWIFYQHFAGNTITGWSSILASIWFIGGLAIFSIGIVGEYIGKIYLETKHRPRYIISEFLND